MRDIFLLALTGTLSATALVRPVVGMLAYVAYSVVGPHSYAWGFTRSFPHVQTLAICTLIGYAFWSEPRQFPRQRELGWLLTVWGVFAFSTALALAPDRALSFFIHISKIFLMILICLSMINTEKRLHLLTKTIALSIGFYGLKGGIFVLRSGGVAPIEGPDDSYLQANNALGMAMAMNVPLLFYLSKTESIAWLRRLMRVMIVFSYPAVAGTFSRGAWLGLAVVTALLVLKAKSKALKVVAALALVAAAFAIVPRLSSEQLTNRFRTLNNIEQDNSAQSRLWSWTFCARVGSELPLSGAGFDYYSLEAYARFYPEFLERWPGKVWSCHSIWLTIWGELGIPGVLAWGGLLISSLLSLRRLKQYADTQPEPQWVGPYAEMLQFSLVAYMVCGSFVDIAYFEIYYFLVALIILIKERVRQLSVDHAANHMTWTNEQGLPERSAPLLAKS